MKRFLALVLACLCILSLTSCAKISDKKDDLEKKLLKKAISRLEEIEGKSEDEAQPEPTPETENKINTVEPNKQIEIPKTTVIEEIEEKNEILTHASRLTGQELSASPGESVGIFQVINRIHTEASFLIPDPETWSGGKLYRASYGESEFEPDSMWYSYERHDKQTDMQEYVEAYRDLLEELGFEVREERVLRSTAYYAAKDDLGEVYFRVLDSIKFYIQFPNNFAFEIENETEILPFNVAATFAEHDYGSPDDIFSVQGIDGTEGGGSIHFYFDPNNYQTGDVIDTDDFLSQTNAGSSAKYHINFHSSLASTKKYSTLKNEIYIIEGSQDYFNNIQVEILEKDTNHVAIYYYVEIDPESERQFAVEGIINCASGSDEEDITAFTENGECKNCNGKGYKTCTRCGGDGNVTCSLCGGDGKRYNVLTKKTDDCHRCIRGKENCSNCENGRVKCKVCGGLGHN